MIFLIAWLSSSFALQYICIMFQSRRFINAGGRWTVLLKGPPRLLWTLLFRLDDHAAASRARGSRWGSGRLRSSVVSWKQEHQLPGAQPGSLDGRPPHTGVKKPCGIKAGRWADERVIIKCGIHWTRIVRHQLFEVAEDQIAAGGCVFILIFFSLLWSWNNNACSLGYQFSQGKRNYLTNWYEENQNI